MTLSVYLAAPYQAREAIGEYADELSSIGMNVTSSWLFETVAISAATTGAALGIDSTQAAAHVATDFRDINRADVLVLFTEKAVEAITHATVRSSGGRHVETGYALAKGKHVLVVGEAENIFHRPLLCVRDWHTALLELVSISQTLPVVEAEVSR